MNRSSGRGFLTRMGLRNIITNRTMSIASVLVLVSCLMLVGLVFLAAVNLNALFTQFSTRNVIMVFLVPGLEPEQIDELGQRIERLDSVSACDFTSGEEAYQKALASNAADYKLLEGIDKQFMPDGFEVLPASLDEFDQALRQLDGLDPAITSVRHFQGVAEQLAAIQKALVIFGAAGIAVLLLVSIFIISSTVQTTMYSRQQEIKVMKSVGAAPAFIRWPFMVEGVCLGLMASVLALGVVLLVYLGLTRALDPLLSKLLGGFAPLSFAEQLTILLPAFLAVGLLTGGGGSMLTITRYLKEKINEKSELEEE